MKFKQWRTPVAFAALVCIQVTVGVVYKAAGSGSYKFSPALSLTMSETIKCALALGMLFVWEENPKSLLLNHGSRGTFLPSVGSLAVLYAVNNILAFEIFLICDPATMSITKSMSSLIVATISYLAFGRNCTKPQWVALVLQAVGLSVVHLNTSTKGEAATHASFLPLILLAIQVSISGTTSVWNSHLLKPDDVNLNAFNSFLYGFGALLNLTFYWVWEGAKHSIFEGWSVYSVGILISNSLIGLAISAIYKYSGALTRTWATAVATSVLYVVVIALGWAVFPIAPIFQGIVIVFGSAYLYQSTARKPNEEAETPFDRSTRITIVALPVASAVLLAGYLANNTQL